MKSNMLVQDLIIELRTKLMITQTKLSKETKISQASLSLYESGHAKPNLLTIKKLIDFANKKANMDLKYTDLEV